MANPVLFPIPDETWVKVAQSVKNCIIWISKHEEKYYYTYRIAGDAAPDGSELSDAVLFANRNLKISKSEEIDVYIFCKTRNSVKSGEVRVDTSPNTINQKELVIGNTLEKVVTPITDILTQIKTPIGSGCFTLYHESSETVYIGDDEIDTTTGVKVEQGDVFEFKDFEDQDNNNLYAICDTGVSVDLITVAGIKE